MKIQTNFSKTKYIHKNIYTLRNINIFFFFIKIFIISYHIIISNSVYLNN